MNSTNKKITLAPFLFALLFVATGASAMTLTDDEMMKKDTNMSDTMMDKEEVKMMGDTMTDDEMMKKEEMTMVPKFDLAMGAGGAEVITLQTFLVSEGLLVMPGGVSKGYFGPLTKAALMSYQSKHGVPSTGYFGPLTRAAMAKGSMMMDDKIMKEDTEMMSSGSDTMMDKEEKKMMDDEMMKKEVR